MKKIAYTALLTCASLVTFSCLSSSSKDSNAIVTKDISIPFMVHSGSTHLECGQQMINLGSTTETGYMENFRLFVHDVELVDENGETYPITLDESDWQTANVTLLSFKDKENCVAATGADVETNMDIIGTYEAPRNADIHGLNFKVGVPHELNHQDKTEAEGPLGTSLLGMHWSWASGYIHMQMEAEINGNSFAFHLGSSGCTGNPVEDEEVTCTRENRPEISLEHFHLGESAVEIDFQALVETIDVSAGGACHSGSGSAICQGGFDALGLDYYDGGGNTLTQANEGQTVFNIASDHE